MQCTGFAKHTQRKREFSQQNPANKKETEKIGSGFSFNTIRADKYKQHSSQRFKMQKNTHNQRLGRVYAQASIKPSTLFTKTTSVKTERKNNREWKYFASTKRVEI